MLILPGFCSRSMWVALDLDSLTSHAKAHGAQEDLERSGFLFDSVADAKKAAEALGQKIDVKDYKRKARPPERQPSGLDRPGNDRPPGRLPRTDPDRRGAVELRRSAAGRGAAGRNLRPELDDFSTRESRRCREGSSPH
jgi:hypothetical protein